MGSLKRKLERKNKKKIEKAEKKMTKQLIMFDMLDDECAACQKPFDKTNKDMVKSWYVVVRDESKEVNLYCPPCWKHGNEMVKDIQEKVNEREKK